jgi:hypothetical protein
VTPELMVERHRDRLRKLADERLHLPAEEPYLEGYNTWCVNVPGSLLVIQVADIAQHLLAILCFFAQNGYAIYDDVNGRKIPGLQEFSSLVDVEEPFPLTFAEQYALTEATAELASACYAGVLLLQAVGLGGWMFDGIDRFSMLGASGNPDVPGLGFRYDQDERWSTPNPTGREGVFEAYCPPHHRDMAAAVEAFAERKFGPGGPFNVDTPGAWSDSPGVRGSTQVHDEAFKACVALQAQYILDTFGKFPGTVPTVFIMNYVQAHHLDLDFYDHSSSQAPTCPPTPPTCHAGTASRRRAKSTWPAPDAYLRSWGLFVRWLVEVDYRPHPRPGRRPRFDRAPGALPRRCRVDPRRPVRGHGAGGPPALPGGPGRVERPRRRLLAPA